MKVKCLQQFFEFATIDVTTILKGPTAYACVAEEAVAAAVSSLLSLRRSSEWRDGGLHGDGNGVHGDNLYLFFQILLLILLHEKGVRMR